MRTVSSLLALLLACGGDSDPKAGGGGEPDPDTAIEDTGAPEEPVTVQMEPGEVAEMGAEADGGVSLTLGQAGTYIVILVSQAEGVGDQYGYGAAADAPAVHTPGDALPPMAPADARPPAPPAAVGDTRTFEVWNGSSTVTIEAVATQVTDLVVYWEDQTTPNEIGVVDTTTVEGVLANFADIVMPRERQVFGVESDVDGDGKLQFLLTYTVNQYGPVAYVTQCDIGATLGCGGHNNGGEIIYLGVPDPEGSYSSTSAITEVVAHEVNHLIYGWHKYVAQGRPNAGENIYLTEGMSALAQDLTGYNNGNQYVWAAALEAIDALGPAASIDSVSVNDFLRGSGYYDYDRDGALRGGAYLFLRYLFEQAGGFEVGEDGSFTDAGGIAFLHDWFDQEALGEDTVEATTGRSINDVALDWYTALVVTGLVENDNPAWSYQDRVKDPITGYEFGVDPYDKIHGWLKLNGPLVQPIDEADGAIRAGGVEYLEVTVAAGDRLVVPVDPAAGAVARVLRVE